MIDDRPDKLLRELFSLISKYSRADFEAAIKLLESGQAVRLATRAARAALNSKIEPTKGPATRKKTKTPKERLDEFLTSLAEKNEPDLQPIVQFLNETNKGAVLTTAPSLKEYSRRLGLSQDAKFDRRVAIRRIGEFLLNQPVEKRTQFIAEARQMGSRKSSLQDWSDIINKEKK